MLRERIYITEGKHYEIWVGLDVPDESLKVIGVNGALDNKITWADGTGKDQSMSKTVNGQRRRNSSHFQLSYTNPGCLR
jgi:hypothetical protein